MLYDDLIKRAQLAGLEHGRNAGSWVIDGNTSEETARAILDGIEEGDPAVLDQLPTSPLSSEWSGDPTPDSVFEDLGMSGNEDYASEILDAYEAAFAEGVEDEVVRSARAILS